MLVILDLLIGLKEIITQKMDSEDIEKERAANFLMSYNDRFLNELFRNRININYKLES